ncbi:MAG TPA: twin-arginine translocase TatA/TatE family subunit [Acidimicrobiales bacterium]|nr:twin-arginine translocase TatA/TatE family subunit [Acidimicrobiales bacterium]
MGSVGPAELLIVLVAALVVLGPTRLPDAARQLGKALAEFRRVSSDLQAEVRDALSDHDVPLASPDPITEAIKAREEGNTVAPADETANVIEGGEAASSPPPQE